MRYLFSGPVSQLGFLGNYFMENKIPPAYYMIYLVVAFLVVAAAAYLLGSINTAIVISTKKYGHDIRGYGSGNAGMTNMFRTFGKAAGFLTLGGDVLKALVSVVLGFCLMGGPGQYVAGFFCMAGHVFPVYYRFKGGKGVIVSAVTVLLIDPLVFAALALIFGLMFAATQIISASSITAAFFYPMVVYAFNGNAPNILYIVFSIFMSFSVIAMHKDNIHRLLNKTEKKFTIHKDKK
ncbi:MAG: glycerol-3-phosphate acyltransferase [Clostridia bacterium]|nr:glycerol-3-phosphate acyltransferase [Clostridia bacterium]